MRIFAAVSLEPYRLKGAVLIYLALMLIYLALGGPLGHSDWHQADETTIAHNAECHQSHSLGAPAGP
jgi:hypothetical protein